MITGRKKDSLVSWSFNFEKIYTCRMMSLEGTTSGRLELYLWSIASLRSGALHMLLSPIASTKSMKTSVVIRQTSRSMILFIRAAFVIPARTTSDSVWVKCLLDRRNLTSASASLEMWMPSNFMRMSLVMTLTATSSRQLMPLTIALAKTQDTCACSKVMMFVRHELVGWKKIILKEC